MIGISALRWQLREMLHQLRKRAEGAFHALLPGTARKAFRDGTAPNIFVSRTLGPNRSYGRVFEGAYG